MTKEEHARRAAQEYYKHNDNAVSGHIEQRGFEAGYLAAMREFGTEGAARSDYPQWLHDMNNADNAEADFPVNTTTSTAENHNLACSTDERCSEDGVMATQIGTGKPITAQVVGGKPVHSEHPWTKEECDKCPICAYNEGMMAGFKIATDSPKPTSEEEDEAFERLWRHLPAAYDSEIKDLYRNVFENGYRWGLARARQGTGEK